MPLFKKVCIAVLFVAFAQTANAQDDLSRNNSGSFYSLFGMGMPFDNTTARESGMGIFGVSLDNSESNSLQNPAFWGSNNLTTATSGVRLSRFNVQSMADDNMNALLEAGYLQLTFPIYRQKLGVSASLYPVTKSNYRIFSEEANIISPGDTVRYITDLKGTGGVNKLEIGFGWQINRYLSVGYAPSLAFITKSNSEKVYFQQSGYNNNQIDNKISGATLAHRFGALLGFRRFSLGAAVQLPINIDANRERTVVRNVSNAMREVTLNSENGSIYIPLELNSGFTYYPSPLVNISLEGQLQKWSEYESEISPGYESSEVQMSDRYRLGLGAEFHPYKYNSDKFLSKFRYSAGLSYDSGHLSINDHNIDTYWLSAGLGILSRSRSTVDISFRYGIRGTTSDNLIQENIWTINLSVNLMEFMFHRPKLD